MDSDHPDTISGLSGDPGGRRAAVAFVFVTVMLDMLALGIVIPVLPKLVEGFLGGDTAHAASVFGMMGALWALMQFVCSPLLGALSDRFGRRPVILGSNVGLGLDYILMALAPTLPWLFVGRIINGITSASVSTAYAYIADITAPEKRPAAFGLMGAAFGVGFVVGPAIGGLLGGLDPRLPFWVAAGASLLNAAYGYFVLPESLSRERRTGFKLAKANPLGSLRLLAAVPGLAALAATQFLHHLSHVVLPTVTVLYAGYRYGWRETEVGLSLAAIGLASVVVQAGLVKPVIAALGAWRTLILGLCSGMAGFAIYGLAPTGWLFLGGVPLVAVWGLSTAAAQGLMSVKVDATRQGQLQGAIASVQGFASLIGPLLFSQVFAFAIGGSLTVAVPGAPFLLASALLAVAVVVALVAMPAAVNAP
jgi:DHA1 family tetracycline resistance protein-like MFS transporter